ncbi:hypothetical protein CmeUKMEL1_03000 [Cryptosporidium meleagridis]|uniref:Uncharacterized protein n=1 Tax=Cryptosporidium meleagridis TaxID=93969 RepID=A0A2P4YXM8_9CRYT|nr:hypothetical protein CmeUKMEL1_03000 [Cryptosporidium meleagridis]
MSFRFESENLELFEKVGVSKQEAELLSHINEAVKEITSKIQDGDIEIKIRTCKELLQLIAAIRQDVLGDFPSALLTLNLELWDLLINSLSSCCCPSVSDKTYKAIFPGIYENSSTDGYMGSSCCVVLKEKILELLTEMIQSINELLTKNKAYSTNVPEIEFWILNLAETVIPSLVCSSLKSSISSHCECKLEPLVSLSFVVQESISTYSELLMKESRLWSTLFRLLMSCNDLNSNAIGIKKKVQSKQTQFEPQVVDFSVSNLKFLDSAQLICSTFTRINFFLDNEGYKYFTLLAAGDIFSQFIKYISTIFKIVYFEDIKMCNTKLDFLFNQKFDLPVESFAKYHEEVESSDKITDLNDLDSLENIEDIYNFSEELNSANNSNHINGSASEKVHKSETKQSKQIDRFETNSLMSCIVFLLGNEKIIEFDSFRIMHSDSIRFTILDVLESLFQSNDLASLDSVSMISQTLFVYDFISLLYPNTSNYSLEDEVEYNFSNIEKLTERFIKSPIHVVASIIYILRSDASKENLSKHLSILLDYLFSLKNSPFENLIPITLGYLFDLLCQESYGSKNLASLFDVLIERVSNECLHFYSPLTWISKVITLDFVLQNEKVLPNSSKIILSLKLFLSKWTKVSELMISSPNIKFSQSRLRGLRRCILYCSLILSGSRDNLDSENLAELYMVSTMLTLILKNRSLRRTSVLQLVDLLSKRAKFSKDDLNLEVVNDLEFIERQWNLNTKHIFFDYFTLVDLEKDELSTAYEQKIYGETLLVEKTKELDVDDNKSVITSMEESNLSVLKTPDSFRLSKLLSAIKNPRIQSQIKISALKSLTKSLTSSKISCKLFCIYVDELVKILMNLSCKSFCTKKQNSDNYSRDESAIDISELILIEENSLFYHLSIALNAIFISRSYRKNLLEYLAASYSIMLIHHLSIWIFSSSEECRSGSFSLLTTILIIILKTGVISDTVSIEPPDDLFLDKTTTCLKTSSLAQNMLILPTSTRETKDYREIYEEELYENSEYTSPLKFEEAKKPNLIKPLIFQTNVSQDISKVLWDLDRLFRKRSIKTSGATLGEFLHSVFSLSFPWTRMTSQAVRLENEISKTKDSIDSVLSKLIMLLGQNSPEYLSEIERYSDLINAQSRNIDIKMLAVLKVIHSILNSFQYVNSESVSETLSKYSSFIVVILSYFNNYFRDKNGNFIVGTIRPKISFGIFDTISLCLDSCNGALCELLFEILPNNIQWSFIILQVPKLIDPINTVHSPTTMLLVTKLLSKMPLRRWFEEDPRYTLECLKLLILNKSLFCNRELPELLLCAQTFQDSYFIKKVISIFDKISVSENPNHPINELLQKSLLKWLLGVGLVSSSFEVQTKIWNLKLALLDKWDYEHSNNTYSIISNFRIPNTENIEMNQQISWGFIFSRSIKSLNHLINNMSYLVPINENLIKSNIGWRRVEFFEYLASILRFIEVFLTIQHRPIETESNENFDQSIGEAQLVMTTLTESMEVIAEELITPFLNLITMQDSNIEKERLLFTNLMFGFVCKLSRFLPFSSLVFQKFADNLNLFSSSLSGISHLELSINSFLLQIKLVSCILKTDSSCFGVLREHIIILFGKIPLKKISSDQMNKLLSLLLSFFDKKLKNQEICSRLIEKISSICNEVFLRMSEILPKSKDGHNFTLELPPSLNFNNNYNLLMGVSLLSLKLSQIVSIDDSSNSLCIEQKKKIFNSVIIGIEISSKISISSEFLTLYCSLDQINIFQESLALLVSALSIFNSSSLSIEMGEEFIRKLFNHIFTIWENFIYLTSFFSKSQMSHSEELYHKLRTQQYEKKELYKEIKLCIDYYIQIITMDIFTELLTNNLNNFDPKKFADDLKNIWLFINNSEESLSKINYPIIYFSSFIYKIKVKSSGTSDLGDWNGIFNRNFYLNGLLDYVLLRTSEILVEVREICLGELRSCTIASLRAMGKQKNKNKFNENVFLSQMCCLFQFIKVIGLFLAEFEGPHNLLTNNKLKPLLNFTLESLAFLSCISKQLEAELERNNRSGFETCIRTWWKYTCKITNESQDIEYFSYMITQIISLLLSCSSQIIPISETQMTNITQGANPVPLSDLARSQSQGSARFHDLFINLLDTESSVGLRLSRGALRFPIEINEENGFLMSNVTKKELNKLDGFDLKINPKKSRMLLDNIVLNDSVPIPIKCGVLKLFLSLALSSSKKKFFKHWKVDEFPDKIKILSILEKAKISRSSEFLVLSLALLEVLLSFNSNQLVSSAEHVRRPPRAYSDSQCSSITILLELLKVEAETFEDLDLNSRTYPIIQDLFNKCFALLEVVQN